MAKTPAALVVDQDLQGRFEIKQAIKACGLSVAAESNFGMEAITVASETHPDIIMVGMNDPMERPLQTVETLSSLVPDTPIIIYSDSRDIEAARKAMLAGARDFLTRPVRPEVLRQSVLKALEAEENRRLRKSGEIGVAPTQGTIVTVFGAKGGIGKSTISTNLAVALTKHATTSVAVVDLDNGFGDIGGMLDAKPQRTLADLARDIDVVTRGDLQKYMFKHELSGLDVLVGPGVLEWRHMSADLVRRVIEFLAKNYDTVVIDTSGTLTEFSEMALEMATIVLWVTTTEFASVRDSLEAMRALESLSFSWERVRIITNAVLPDDDIRPTVIQEAMGHEIFWSIPYDKKVRQGTHLGQPVVITTPQSVAAKSFTDLATVIAGGRLEKTGKMRSGFRWRLGSQPTAAEG